MFKVTFRFENGSAVEAFAAEGENLLEVARKTNVAIDAPCSGNAACGKCRVKLLKGELDSQQTLHITDEEYAQGWRLSCVSKVIADVEVEVPDIASAYKSRMKVADLDSAKEIEIFERTKADVEEAGIVFKNDMDVIRVTMNEPTLDDTMPDLERLTWAVEKVCGTERVKVPFTVMKNMAETLRKYKFDVQCVIRRCKDKVEVLDILGLDEDVRVCGLAVDIGTTSVAALIIDMQTGTILAKASTGNGQIRYGADKTNTAALELAQLGQAIDHMAENLEKQEDVRRQLTSDVAHELRTPAANVSSQLEAMIEEVWEPTKERLQSCYDELGRISGIISDLEKLRQIEASNMVLEKEPVDLLELAQAVKTAFEPELAKKKLTCMVTGESAIISGDQKRLHQVIFNLVSNAVKYSTESGQILIDIHNLGKNVQLTVKDQGIGIAKEDIPLMLERFYRTDRSRNRKTGGAGIGLTIVKAIVLAHGGNISVESVKGCGSCFMVVLPKK